MQRDLNVIVGLGVTGLSCANYLALKKIPFAVTDSRLTPPNLTEFKKQHPDVTLSLGQLDENLLREASQLILSPGISLHEPVIAELVARGIPVIGDIELFALATQKPVIAITGTNAKSTVTTIVGEMAKAAGLKTEVGGNLGVAALDLLKTVDTELYVLELSSFQLETMHSLQPAVATVLNVTPDHMDRYASFEDYRMAKHRVYANCGVAVCNRDDPLTHSDQFKKEKITFTLKEPRNNEFGLLKKNNEIFLALENQTLLPVRELPILGQQHQANALAALAIGYGYGFDMQSMLQAVLQFKGLPHRCQLVRDRQGVLWYNDSKGTNVGATLAAIEGLGNDTKGKLILIAGGVGKNADFSPLILPIEKYVKTMVLMGEAAPVLAAVIGDRVEVKFAKSMQEAVEMSANIAEREDNVLLSPACASLDMFKNFEHRGQVFMECVLGLPE